MSTPTAADVRYFFYAGHDIAEGRQLALVKLAYATARDAMLTPTMILIRADIHATTSVNGRYIADQMGWHATFAFKDGDTVHDAYHIASHGYTTGRHDFVLKQATHSIQKPDCTRRGKKGKPVWPDLGELEEYDYTLAQGGN